MSSRTGKHFRNEKDLIIHDKTGRVSYYLGIVFTGSFLVPSVTPRDSFKSCKLKLEYKSFVKACHSLVYAFFYLQILISWNRFARSLKEAFELYWETKQVWRRAERESETVFIIR